MGFSENIVWPSDERKALVTILQKMRDVAHDNALYFTAGYENPLEICELRISGADVAERRAVSIDKWWDIVEQNGIQNFSSFDVLMARIAIALLNPEESNYDTFPEQWSWFLEVVELLKQRS